jgi:hypothetical protein
MQTLTIKQVIEGVEETVGVRVLRVFPDASGRTIYHHSNGVYGYKDGTPVQSDKEFAIIGNKVHRDLAQAWWDAIGKEISEKFYAAREAAEREALSDFQEKLAFDNTDLDAVMYQRRPVGGKKNDPWEPPFAWMEHFSKRPDWWGQAEEIKMRGWEYKMSRNVAAENVQGNVNPNEV